MCCDGWLQTGTVFHERKKFPDFGQGLFVLRLHHREQLLSPGRVCGWTERDSFATVAAPFPASAATQGGGIFVAVGNSGGLRLR